MKKLFEISTEERNRILEMHTDATKKLYLSEQKITEFKASTDNIRMYNFNNPKGKSFNSNFGLQGTPEIENYYFKSTIGDIVRQSRGDKTQYLINFKPLSNAGDYVEFLRIGNKEINGSGTETFDIDKNMVIVATHNGLLAIRRLMEEMPKVGYNGEKAKATVTIAGTEKSSESRTYDPNEAKKLVPTANYLIRLFSVLITPKDKRKNINSTITETIKNYSSAELKNYIKKVIDSYLVSKFLPNPKDWETIKNQYQLKGSENINLDEIFSYAEFGGEKNSLNQNLWENFWTSFKNTYLSNYSTYVNNISPENASNSINEMSKSISNQNSSFSLSDTYRGLFTDQKTSTVTTSKNKISRDKTVYGTGQ